MRSIFGFRVGSRTRFRIESRTRFRIEAWLCLQVSTNFGWVESYTKEMDSRFYLVEPDGVDLMVEKKL